MSFRRERAVETLRREIADILESELEDPRVPAVHITHIKLAPDYSEARVFVTPEEGGLKGVEDSFVAPLNRASGFVRTALAERDLLRRTPRLIFQLDRGQLNAARVDELLDRVKRRSKPPEELTAILLAAGLALSMAVAPLRAEQPALERYEASASIMGTEFRIALYGEKRGVLASTAVAAFDEARRIDALISNYQPDSELSRINDSAADAPVAVSTEMAEFLETSFDYSRASDGAFDITVGALMKVWGFYKGSGRLPSKREVAGALARSGRGKVRFDPAARTVALEAHGLELDPGGIGKGYAVEKMVALLREYGVRSAFLSAGSSSLYAIGAPPDEPHGWRVEVKNPRDADKVAAELYLKDESLSSSGSYEKFFEVDGKRYAHIMDPRTGWPADELDAVSVRSASALDSEVWTTALFVNGEAWAREKAPVDLEILTCRQGACRWLQR